MSQDDGGVIGLSLNGTSFPATAPLVAEQGRVDQVRSVNEGRISHPMGLHGMVTALIVE